MMIIVKKIRAAMAAKELVDNAWKDRRGWKTPQFWLALLTSAGSLIAGLAGILDPVIAGVAAASVAGLYAIVRGIQKAQQDGTTKWWLSTEWQLGALTALAGTLLAVQQAGVDAQWVVTANAVLVAVLAHAQHKDLAPEDPAAPPPAPK